MEALAILGVQTVRRFHGEGVWRQCWRSGVSGCRGVVVFRRRRCVSLLAGAIARAGGEDAPTGDRPGGGLGDPGRPAGRTVTLFHGEVAAAAVLVVEEPGSLSRFFFCPRQRAASARSGAAGCCAGGSHRSVQLLLGAIAPAGGGIAS